MVLPPNEKGKGAGATDDKDDAGAAMLAVDVLEPESADAFVVVARMFSLASCSWFFKAKYVVMKRCTAKE